MNAEEKLREATRRAEADRAAFLANLAALKQRVSPARLKEDAIDKARTVARESKDRTVETFRAHPFAVSAGVVALLAYLARRPLFRLARRLPMPRASKPPLLRQRLRKALMDQLPSSLTQLQKRLRRTL